MTGATQLRLVLATACLLAGCSAPAVDDPPDALTVFYEELREHARGFPFADGTWDEHYGDAPFYGVAFYARTAPEGTDADRARAEAAVRWNAELVGQAADDLAFLIDNLDAVILAALGLVEHMDATGDLSTLDDVDRVIHATNDLLLVTGDYAGSGTAYVGTYGPTTMTAAVALLNLQYALYLEPTDADDHVVRAEEIVLAVGRNAYEGGRYRFAPDEDRLFLYPNVMMMLTLARLFEATGDAGWLATAESLFEAIAPLRDEAQGNYHSPYSADYMGATTDDYSTLSSQNYLAMALLVLHETTGKVVYLDETLRVLEFVRTRLYDAAQGRLLHHWMDGAIAQPGDPEYFCTGCNLQFLYVVWYLKSLATAD